MEKNEIITGGTFLQRFPELTLKEQLPIKVEDLRYSMFTMERLLGDIDRYCLSKTKVREAITKCTYDTDMGIVVSREELLKELGLEEFRYYGRSVALPAILIGSERQL